MRLAPLALALSATLIVGACSKTSRSDGLRPVPIPVLDSEASTPCRDPGVDLNAKIAVVETRLALAECEGRRELAVAAYEAVRKEFGTSPSKERDEDQ